MFSPPPGASDQEIKVTVEALRGGMPIQSATEKVNLKTKTTDPNGIEPVLEGPQELSVSGSGSIEITKLPRYDPTGGPDTRGDIAGVVRGIHDPKQYRVILYSKTDFWYIQPLLGFIHEINSDGTWSSWTHTGVEYAALLVQANYSPSATLGALPSVGDGGVVAEVRRTGTR